MKSEEPKKQILIALKGLSPTLLFAAAVIISTFLIITDVIP